MADDKGKKKQGRRKAIVTLREELNAAFVAGCNLAQLGRVGVALANAVHAGQLHEKTSFVVSAENPDNPEQRWAVVLVAGHLQRELLAALQGKSVLEGVDNDLIVPGGDDAINPGSIEVPDEFGGFEDDPR